MNLFYCKLDDERFTEWFKPEWHSRIMMSDISKDKWAVKMNGLLITMNDSKFRSMCRANPYYVVRYTDRGGAYTCVVKSKGPVEELETSVLGMLNDECIVTEVEMISKSVFDDMAKLPVEVITF